MATPVLDDTAFPLAACEPCGRDVLAYVESDRPEVGEIRRCVHCDAIVAEWRAADAHELEDAGYSVLEARGCGNGGGCSSGCGTRR